ncbi:MAG TPA: MFS transporter, partial [Candidatus Eisenbacteria bacterium]|nr:MFS transporter [Candidatus Eisenbacteria bacterium]
KLASVGQATLLVTVMALAYFAPSYPIGMLADRVSRKKLLGLGLAINGLGFVGLALAPNYATALVCVIIAGIGGSFYHPAATALVAQLFPVGTGKALGLVGIGASVGFFFGPLYVGWRAAHSGWRAPVLELGILGVVVAGLFRWLAQERKSFSSTSLMSEEVNDGDARKFPLPSTGRGIEGEGCPIDTKSANRAFQSRGVSEMVTTADAPTPHPGPHPIEGRGGTNSGASASPDASASQNGGLRLSLSPRERAGVRGKEVINDQSRPNLNTLSCDPVGPPEKMFPTPALWMFFIGASFFFCLRDFAGNSMGSLGSLFLQQAQGYQLQATGLAISGIFLAGVVSNPLFGSLSDHGRIRWISLVLLTGALMIALFPHVPRAWVIPAFLLYGFFFMSSYPMVEAALMESVHDSVRGRVFGIFITIGGLVGNLSHWVVGVWVKNLGPSGNEPAGYYRIYLGLAGLVLLSLLGLPCLHAIRKREDELEHPITVSPQPVGKSESI